MEARLDRPTDEGSSDGAAARLALQTACSPAVADSTQSSAAEEGSPPCDRKGPVPRNRLVLELGRVFPRVKVPRMMMAVQISVQEHPYSQTGDSPKTPGVPLASPIRDGGGVVSPLVVKRGPGRPRKDGSSPVQRKKLSSHSFPGRPRVRSRKPSLLPLAGSSGQTPPCGTQLERSPTPLRDGSGTLRTTSADASSRRLHTR
ncbi:hypothetical protein MRX96_036352 [Rhipicephalus microplus]